jgi:hypothetical protein
VEGEVRVRQIGKRSHGVGRVGAAPPINVETISTEVAEAALEGHDISGIELLLLDEAAPAFGHDVALAAVPVRVAESPGLSISVLEVKEEAFLVGGGVQREVLLGVLLWDDKAIEFSHIAGSDNFVEHVLSLHHVDALLGFVLLVSRGGVHELVKMWLLAAIGSGFVGGGGGVEGERKLTSHHLVSFEFRGKPFSM